MSVMSGAVHTLQIGRGIAVLTPLNPLRQPGRVPTAGRDSLS